MDLINTRQQLTLIGKLRQVTADGRLQWQSIQNPFTFASSPGKITYTIYSQDNDDEPPYGLTVAQTGTTGPLQVIRVDSARDHPLGGELNAQLRALYLVVKRTAMGLDEVVTDMFAELEGLGGGDRDNGDTL